MDGSLEKKVGFLDSISNYYYGKDYCAADLSLGSEMVFSYNNNKDKGFAVKAADMARSGVVEALKIGGYVAAIGFAYTWLM